MNRQKSFENEEAAALFLVPTPIGNLNEVSERTRQVLDSVDVISCEDTRNSGNLLKLLGIHKPLVSHHEHNQEVSVPKIMNLLQEGKKVAVISDAGYPLISDPGAGLVRTVLEEGFPVIPLSGPNAALDALVASGLDTQHYLYYGFLDAKSARRKQQLEGLKTLPYTMIFYEAPHRIASMLEDLLEVLGDRRICLARELTKLHEEFIRGSVKEVLSVCDGLRGEMVVVVEGYDPREDAVSEEDALKLAQSYMEQGMKTKKAAAEASAKTGIAKNVLYQMLVNAAKED